MKCRSDNHYPAYAMAIDPELWHTNITVTTEPNSAT